MCVVSMVGDHYRDKWEPRRYFPSIIYSNPTATSITREEFDQLRAEVAELKLLLIRAKAYDEKNNEPHCEIEEKMEILRKVAELVGVDLNDVLDHGKDK